MQRRTLLAFAAAGFAPALARAHHGWSGFDQDRPIYLEGKAESVVWKNPHAELMLRLSARPGPAGRPGAGVRCRPNRRRSTRRKRARGDAAADAQGPGLGARARAAHAHGSVEGRRDQERARRSRRSATPSRPRRARR